MGIILYFLVMAATFMALSQILPGFHVTGWGPAILGAVILAVVNTIVKPILFVLTLPLTVLTLGLFLFILNAMMLALTAWLVPGISVDGWITTIVAAIALSVVSMIWKAAVKEEKQSRRDG